MHNLEGVLLDVDGTLVDSNDAHAEAWMRALIADGVEADFTQIRSLIGKGGDKLLSEVSGIDADSIRGKTISGHRAKIFQNEYLPKLKAFPKAADLLLRMKQRGLRLAIASSAKENELKPLLKICGADKLVEASTSSDDADNSKPDPDIIHAALKTLKVPSEKAILLGDIPYDIEAGNRAGVEVVALRCGGWSDSHLGQAVAIYDCPADLLAKFDESPFGKR